MEMLGLTIQPVYLSPHLDDAALSCGGTIYQQACQGLRPLVITCMSGVPDYRELSPFAREQHRRWGEPAGAMERRRCEDAAAMEYLGADYQHWDYLDCIYRRAPGGSTFLYDSEAALFGELHPDEQTLIAELTTQLQSYLARDHARIVAPMAIGHHVDHQLVMRAALCLAESGYRVSFYEDYPYAEDPQKLAQALEVWIQPPVAHVNRLNPMELDAKINALHRYLSQLGNLFHGEASMPGRVQSYALAVAAGSGYGERYWEKGAS
jgi:LmbE family N-acetylglucosaminyl deacetylase